MHRLTHRTRAAVRQPGQRSEPGKAQIRKILRSARVELYQSCTGNCRHTVDSYDRHRMALEFLDSQLELFQVWRSAGVRGVLG